MITIETIGDLEAFLRTYKLRMSVTHSAQLGKWVVLLRTETAQAYEGMQSTLLGAFIEATLRLRQAAP